MIQNNKLNIFFKFFLIISTTILTFSSVFSEKIELNDLDYLKLNISNEIQFLTTIEKSHSISKFEVNSHFFPKSYNGSQYLNSFESSNPNYKIINQNSTYYINFDYKNNLQKTNTIYNNFIIESTTNKPQIEKKINYPLDINSYNKSLKIYLEFSDLVDTNTQIKNKASELATGEDDLFIIATKIANYITNDITYDLKTVLANPNQKSSDVFISKQGVCKEITNLYASMLRSLGIPVRFVTGYSYTTSQELVEFVGSNWGGHVWAEVLIGNTWVPFDLTYNQYGYVDSTHIITDKSSFIRTSGITLDALSYGIKITPNSLTLKNEFNVIDKKEKLFDNGFKISLDGPTELGFESFGYVKINIQNTKPYYQNLFLKFAKPSEVEYLNQNDNIHVFKPNEKKEIYFKYKIPKLDENYLYTFPFLIYNDFIQENYSVKVSQSLDKIEKLELPNEKQTNKYFTNNNLQYSCDYKLNSQNIDLLCSIKNPNNHNLNNLELCLETNCKKLNLTINEKKELTYQTEQTNITLLSKYNSKSEKLKLSFNYPKLIITQKTNYQQLILNSEISNFLKGLKLKVTIDNKIIFDDIISKFQEFDINLNPGKQNIEIELYHNNIEFDTFKTELEIQKTPPIEKLKIFITNLFK